MDHQNKYDQEFIDSIVVTDEHSNITRKISIKISILFANQTYVKYQMTKQSTWEIHEIL